MQTPRVRTSSSSNLRSASRSAPAGPEAQASASSGWAVGVSIRTSQANAHGSPVSVSRCARLSAGTSPARTTEDLPRRRPPAPPRRLPRSRPTSRAVRRSRPKNGQHPLRQSSAGPETAARRCRRLVNTAAALAPYAQVWLCLVAAHRSYSRRVAAEARPPDH